MSYTPPQNQAFKSALRQARRIKHAKNKKRAIHTLCRKMRAMLAH